MTKKTAKGSSSRTRPVGRHLRERVPVLECIAESDGSVASVNYPAWNKLLGVSEEEIMNRDLAALIHPILVGGRNAAAFQGGLMSPIIPDARRKTTSVLGTMATRRGGPVFIHWQFVHDSEDNTVYGIGYPLKIWGKRPTRSSERSPRTFPSPISFAARQLLV